MQDIASAMPNLNTFNEAAVVNLLDDDDDDGGNDDNMDDQHSVDC